MRTLVIETATAACSVALLDDGAVADARHAIVGRGHAEQLVAMIAALDGGGRPDRILVDCGPGSFTGIRVGIAAARGLGLGWRCPVFGYSSLPLIAASRFAANPGWSALAVVLEGGHGEVFMQRFVSAPFAATTAMQSLRPDAALAMLGGDPAVGSGVRFLTALDPLLLADDDLPDARDCRLLSGDFITLPPRPIYGRAPDAKPMAGE